MVTQQGCGCRFRFSEFVCRPCGYWHGLKMWDQSRHSCYATYSSEVMPLFHRSNLWGSPKCPCTLIVLVYTLAPKYLYKNYFKAKIYTIWVHGPVGDCDRCYSLLCGRNPTPPAQIPETDPFHRRCYFVSKTHATQFSPKQSRKHQVCDP